MIHVAQRMHAFVNGLFKPKDEATARELYADIRLAIVLANERQTLTQKWITQIRPAYPGDS